MKLIEKIQTIILLLRSCKAQFLQEVAHEHPAHRGHYSGVHRNHYQNHYEIDNGPSDYRRYNFNSGNCRCSCQECDYKPKRCCKRICKICRKSQPQLAQFQQVPSSLVMIPYLMPFLVYPIKNTTHTHRMTTTKPETKSTQPIWTEQIKDMEFIKFEEENFTTTTPTFFLDPEYENQEMKLAIDSSCAKPGQCNDVDSKQQKFKSSARGKLHRKLEMFKKMRPTVKTKGKIYKDMGKTLPKYGLIPIPDDMAEKLMLQLQNL